MPLETALRQKAEAAETAKADLAEADKEFAAARAAWQADVMAAATTQLVDMVGSTAKLKAERDEAVSAKVELEAMRARVADFCKRNPETYRSLCPAQAAQATGG
jgi:hypothetical protein